MRKAKGTIGSKTVALNEKGAIPLSKAVLQRICAAKKEIELLGVTPAVLVMSLETARNIQKITHITIPMTRDDCYTEVEGLKLALDDSIPFGNIHVN